MLGIGFVMMLISLGRCFWGGYYDGYDRG